MSKFLAYEVITDILFGRTSGSEKIEGLEGALAGSFASLFSQIITTPLDVSRTRMMISDTLSGDILRYMAIVKKNEGLRALFAGIGPRAVRALLSGAIQFFAYEITQNSFR